jgi:hypothetical protein
VRSVAARYLSWCQCATKLSRRWLDIDRPHNTISRKCTRSGLSRCWNTANYQKVVFGLLDKPPRIMHPPSRPLRVAMRLVRYHRISDPRLVYVSLKPVWIGFKHSLLRYFHRFTNAVRDGCPKHNFNSKHPLLLCISLQTYQRGSGNTRRPRDLFHGRHHGVTASPKASHQTAGSSGTQGAYVLFALLRAGPSSRGCNSNRTYVSLV